MNKKLVYRHFIGYCEDSHEFSVQFENGVISAYVEPRAKQWSGPQDGLPPVGSTVEVIWSDRGPVYKRALVLAHDEGNAVYRWIEGERKGEYQADRTREIRLNHVNPMFRPIKTPDQLAAEQRETAIREIMDIADVDCRVTAARLVDAGFKREVV